MCSDSFCLLCWVSHFILSRPSAFTAVWGGRLRRKSLTAKELSCEAGVLIEKCKKKLSDTTTVSRVDNSPECSRLSGACFTILRHVCCAALFMFRKHTFFRLELLLFYGRRGSTEDVNNSPPSSTPESLVPR